MGTLFQNNYVTENLNLDNGLKKRNKWAVGLFISPLIALIVEFLLLLIISAGANGDELWGYGMLFGWLMIATAIVGIILWFVSFTVTQNTKLKWCIGLAFMAIFIGHRWFDVRIQKTIWAGAVIAYLFIAFKIKNRVFLTLYLTLGIAFWIYKVISGLGFSNY